MGVRRNFSRGGNVDILLVHIPVANDAMQMDLHKTLYPFYTREKIPHERTRCVCICLKSYSGGVVIEFAKRLYCLSSFTGTAELGFDLNYPQLRFQCHISLSGLKRTSQNLVWNVFYILSNRNAFSFHSLVNVQFWAVSENKSLFQINQQPEHQ